MKIQPRASAAAELPLTQIRGSIQAWSSPGGRPSGAKTALREKTLKPDSSEFAGNLVQDIVFLRRFMTEQGKILSRRSTGITAKEQRKISKAIKNARLLGLLQFVHTR